MPMITVRYITPMPRPTLRLQIAALISGLSAEHLKKDPKVTAVLVEAADPAGWFIAGDLPTEAGFAAFWVDVKVTAGMNTRAETTSFVHATFTAMSTLLGKTHPESYVLVHAVDGHAYGFGGRTQDGRWAEANPG